MTTTTVRDKLWMWGHPAGSHDTDYGTMPRPSRMTPAEGALYLGVPNLMFIRYKGNPPLVLYDQYALSFRPLRRVVWSLTGASGAIHRSRRGQSEGSVVDNWSEGSVVDN